MGRSLAVISKPSSLAILVGTFKPVQGLAMLDLSTPISSQSGRIYEGRRYVMGACQVHIAQRHGEGAEWSEPLF